MSLGGVPASWGAGGRLSSGPHAWVPRSADPPPSVSLAEVSHRRLPVGRRLPLLGPAKLEAKVRIGGPLLEGSVVDGDIVPAGLAKSEGDSGCRDAAAAVEDDRGGLSKDAPEDMAEVLRTEQPAVRADEGARRDVQAGRDVAAAPVAGRHVAGEGFRRERADKGPATSLLEDLEHVALVHPRARPLCHREPPPHRSCDGELARRADLDGAAFFEPGRPPAVEDGCRQGGRPEHPPQASGPDAACGVVTDDWASIDDAERLEPLTKAADGRPGEVVRHLVVGQVVKEVRMARPGHMAEEVAGIAALGPVVAVAFGGRQEHGGVEHDEWPVKVRPQPLRLHDRPGQGESRAARDHRRQTNSRPEDDMAGQLDAVVKGVGSWRQRSRPLVVALDGHGASGKSTYARLLAASLGAAVVHTDDFFEPTPRRLASSSPTAHPLSRYYDWGRLRDEALVPLRAGREAAFPAYNWLLDEVSGPKVVVEPRGVVVLEGVFSSAPELSDLVERSVLVDTPEDERLRRLRGRVAPEEWDSDWLAAERSYFATVRPASSFDIIVSGAARLPARLAGDGP